jgi:hypothetical protein
LKIDDNNTMTMKKSILLIVLFIIISCCKKEETIVYSSNIVGEWDWLMTCGGFTGACGTPQTTNRTAKLVFSQDSIFYSYQNDSLTFSSNYSIIRKPVDYKFGSLLINNGYYDYFIIHDTLSFSPQGADFGSTYKRIK